MPAGGTQTFLGLDSFELAVIGAIAGVVAVVVALWQVARTQRALAAAAAARKATLSSLASNQLLALIPQLQAIDLELEAAVIASNLAEARERLVRWWNTAAEVQGLLSRRQEAEEVRDKVEEARFIVERARDRLVQPVPDLAEATEPARRGISNAQSALTVYLGQLRAYPES